MENETQRNPKSGGLVVKAGDRVYMPAGALQIWTNEHGTTGTSAVVVVDPWLPDISANGGTSSDTVDAIMKSGFPVGAICGDTVNACQKSQPLHELVRHPDVSRLRHMAVLDGREVVGVLDLDKARKYHDPAHPILAEAIYEPLHHDNCLRLQKLPVRVLLFMKFVHLETLLARHLCLRDPTLLDIVTTATGADFGALGKLDIGPLRQIETYYIDRLLKDAQRAHIIKVEDNEIKFLKAYRNRLAHGPRWYITRPSEVALLVRCARRVMELTSEVAGGHRS